MHFNRKYINSPHDSAENRRLYYIWNGIRKRCYSENCLRFKDYGGRGITMCDEWQDFDVFVVWARGNGYKSDLTIDRIDNDGNYEPDNCRWTTKKEQNRNKRTNVMVNYNGKTQSLMDWCEELNLPYYTIQKRIKHGMEPWKAFETPVLKSEDSFASMCRKHGMKERVVYDRVYKLGWDLERALNTPVKQQKRVALQ